MRMDILRGIYDRDKEIPNGLLQIERDQSVDIPNGVKGVIGQIFSQPENAAGNSAGGYLDRIAAAGQGWVAPGGGQFSINTYPFGEKSARVFPEFLGVCAGGATINSTLNEVKRYCERAQKVLPLEDEKTVVLLTDKWDGPMFHKKYELDFLRYSLENNVLFIFLLVTDYGISRIPFLCRNRAELDSLCSKRIIIESTLPDDEALVLLRNNPPCIYAEEQNGLLTASPSKNRYLLLNSTFPRYAVK